MDPDNAQHFSLNLASAVDKVYQRNILRQIFYALEVYKLNDCRVVSCVLSSDFILNFEGQTE